jgi:transcriptional regulator with XRE-family HTH domain
MPGASPRSVFCERLREAREAAGLSQKNLGIASGIDRFVASARVNRYEKGTHEPDSGTAGRMARALGLPLAYFYAEDDLLARVIVAFVTASKLQQKRWAGAILEPLSPAKASRTRTKKSLSRA